MPSSHIFVVKGGFCEWDTVVGNCATLMGEPARLRVSDSKGRLERIMVYRKKTMITLVCIAKSLLVLISCILKTDYAFDNPKSVTVSYHYEIG